MRPIGSFKILTFINSIFGEALSTYPIFNILFCVKRFIRRARNKLRSLFKPEPCPPIKDSISEPDSCSINENWKQPRVIIVGAGMAGLSAAQRLLQCGISNFLILEATDRPGGRIHSRWMGDCMTELGAMWIEGASVSNVVFQLASQEGLVQPPLKRFKYAENTMFFTHEGRPIDKRKADVALNTFQELIEAKAVLSELVGKTNSLGEFIEMNLNKELGPLPDEFKADIMNVIGCLYNELQSRLGENPCLVNSKALSERKHLPGGRVRIPLGFGSVLAPLLRGLPPCTIMYCKPVHYISWDPKATTNRAKVVCADKEEFMADYVLVTVSLGVLKQEASTMFIPQLPEKKQKAIKYLGYADVERIFIQYAKPFWSGEAGIGFGWGIKQLKEDSDDWTRGLGELTTVPGSSTTLHGTVGSHPATVLCGTPQDILICKVGDLVRKFTGDSSIPNPINILCSNWVNDPFFSGSFSYLGVESTTCHIDDLAEPVPNKGDLKNIENPPPLLMFAGEATSRYNFSTVHGARESGIREAQRIIDITKIYEGPPSCLKPCPPCKTCPA